MGRCSPQYIGADSDLSLSLCVQVDAEVRDRILCMAEDYAKVLPLAEFRESYELLLVRTGGGGRKRRGAEEGCSWGRPRCWNSVRQVSCVPSKYAGIRDEAARPPAGARR